MVEVMGEERWGLTGGRRVAFSETVEEAPPPVVVQEEPQEGLECCPCLASARFRSRAPFIPFFSVLDRRLGWHRDVGVSVALGQVLSLCLCGTGVTSQLLTDEYKVYTPMTQNFFAYFLICLVYGTGDSTQPWPFRHYRGLIPALAFRPMEEGIVSVLRDRGWKYFVAALLDVEANFLLVLAYQYSNLTSIQVRSTLLPPSPAVVERTGGLLQLLDCWTIPVVLVLSWGCLGTRYLLSHIVGVGICLLGIAALIWADSLIGRGTSGGSDRLKGDLLALAGATLYGMCNVTEEYLVRSFTRSEYLGMVGLFGTLISAMQLLQPSSIIQAFHSLGTSLRSILERHQLAAVRWSDYRIRMRSYPSWKCRKSWEWLVSVLLYLGYAGGMFIFYSLVAEMMRRAGATLFNLSILTADFYTLLAGIFLFKYRVSPPLPQSSCQPEVGKGRLLQFHMLYFVSFAVVVAGSVVYKLKATRERHPERAPPIARCLPRSACCPCFDPPEDDDSGSPATAYQATADAVSFLPDEAEAGAPIRLHLFEPFCSHFCPSCAGAWRRFCPKHGLRPAHS